MSDCNRSQADIKLAALYTVFDFSTVGGPAKKKYPECHLQDTPPSRLTSPSRI
ncbi:hypothetical protein GCM10010520_26390 [Rhizobium viscosum]